ncbi:MAG: YhdT family protein [Bacillota bacterium]|nr:YhdT family protein [Bacillota bacterium]
MENKPSKPDIKELNRQLNKEALLTLGLYALFFLWWFGMAYGLADSPARILGLPAWFFMSCIVGWLLCCAGVTVLVKKFFRPLDLTQFEQPDEREDGDE